MFILLDILLFFDFLGIYWSTHKTWYIKIFDSLEENTLNRLPYRKIMYLSSAHEYGKGNMYVDEWSHLHIPMRVYICE